MQISYIQLLGIISALIIFFWFVWFCWSHFIQVLRRFSFRHLLNGFSQKMWMTVGLGLTFFGFYFVLIFYGLRLIDSQTKLDLFFTVYKNPVPFIYFGLSIFAMTSLGIYATRMVIKHLYNSRHH